MNEYELFLLQEPQIPSFLRTVNLMHSSNHPILFVQPETPLPPCLYRVHSFPAQLNPTTDTSPPADSTAQIQAQRYLPNSGTGTILRICPRQSVPVHRLDYCGCSKPKIRLQMSGHLHRVHRPSTVSTAAVGCALHLDYAHTRSDQIMLPSLDARHVLHACGYVCGYICMQSSSEDCVWV